MHESAALIVMLCNLESELAGNPWFIGIRTEPAQQVQPQWLSVRPRINEPGPGLE